MYSNKTVFNFSRLSYPPFGISNSAFILPQNDSAQALSYGSSARDMLCFSLKVLISFFILYDRYWPPRSECTIIPGFTLRLKRALSNGSRTRPSCILSSNCQLITCRENRSIQTHKYAHLPPLRGMYVISETHTQLGLVGLG